MEMSAAALRGLSCLMPGSPRSVAGNRRAQERGQEAGGWGFKEGKVHCGNPSLCSVLCSRTIVTFNVPANGAGAG